MKAFWRFHLVILIIWLPVALLVLSGARSDEGQFALAIFLCVSVVFGLPTLALVDVIWLIALALCRKPEPNRSKTKRALAALIEYIRKEQARGRTETEVDVLCRQNGWPPAEINEARRNLARLN